MRKAALIMSMLGWVGLGVACVALGFVANLVLLAGQQVKDGGPVMTAAWTVLAGLALSIMATFLEDVLKARLEKR
jgi:hypothetical protein